MAPTKKKGKKKLLLLLLLIGFIGLSTSGAVIAITLHGGGDGTSLGHDSWGSMSSPTIMDGIIDAIEDIGIMLTLVPDTDYGYDYECFDINMMMYEDCCGRCDVVAENCDLMCTPARILMVGEEPFPPDEEQLRCYEECMADTGCEFTHSREDIELLCDTACVDFMFYGYETGPICVRQCTDYYITDGIERTPDVALSCDYELDMGLFECRYETGNETVEWDGTPVTDVNAFFESGYPMFYRDSKSQCESWFRGGTWIDTADKVGCVEFRFFADSGCRSVSIESAKNVCETIGGEFICEDGDISCNM